MVKTKTKKPAAAKPAAAKRGRARWPKRRRRAKRAEQLAPPVRARRVLHRGRRGAQRVERRRNVRQGHPATSVPAAASSCSSNCQRKWLDIDAKNFEYYTFCFVLHLKKKNKNKSGADDRVGTRTQVINGDGELVDLVRETLSGKTPQGGRRSPWRPRGWAAATRPRSESRCGEAAAKLEVPDQVPRGVAAARGRRHGARGASSLPDQAKQADDDDQDEAHGRQCRHPGILRAGP